MVTSICQQQVLVTGGDRVLFMLRYPIFTSLDAFLKDDALGNKTNICHHSVYCLKWSTVLCALTSLVYTVEP